MSDTNWKAVVVLVIGSMIAMSQVADCQFFTKSSQKSIPRMGRRSIDTHSDYNVVPSNNNDDNNNNNPYRRALIDALVDEFGPDLVDLMRPPAANAVEQSTDCRLQSNAKQVASSQQNVVLDRDGTPMDFNELDDFIRGRSLADALNHEYDISQLSRNERALTNNNSNNSGTKSQRQPNYKDASLALRALSANRYLKHLSSGQPLVSYDNFLMNSKTSQQEQQARRQP